MERNRLKNSVTKSKNKLYSFAKNCIDGLLSFPYPHNCVNCKKEIAKLDTFLCVDCYSNLKFSRFEKQPKSSLAQETFFGRVPLNFVSSLLLFETNSSTQNILHNMKYGNAEDLCVYMGVLMGEKIVDMNLEFDYIIPVPLHNKKRFERGYNQSELLGKGLSSVLNVPQRTDVLTKVKNTKTQTKKSREDRVDNVAYSFKVSKSAQIKDKKLLLVDDVLTTGATLEACANVFLNNNIKDISIYTLAYTK